MSAPKVSVCIPAYNHSKYIEQAIESVLTQTITDFELIVVDDCSSDDTFEIAKKYKDPRIKVYRNEKNLGLIPNWNESINKGSGTYIKLLPGDDFLYPDCLLLQTSVLERDKEKHIAMVCGRKHVVDEKGRILLNRGFSRHEKEVTGIYAINRNIRSGGNIIGEAGSIMFRREVLQRTGMFNAKHFYVLDLDLWYKILLHGNLYCLKEVVSAFRVSTTAESTRVKNSQKKDLEDFMEMLFQDKRFGVTRMSCFIGKINIRLITIAKKLLYRFWLRKK
jgi:glycosyltransferase involved in cell wall biosynthesis